MQDEEMDIKIREAAEQHHPPYDDKAWDKMSVLLDKHLPQRKDRRRWLYFLFLFLLLDGAIAVAILKPWKSSSTNIAESKPLNNSSAGNGKEISSPGTDNNTVINNKTGDELLADQQKKDPAVIIGNNTDPVAVNTMPIAANNTLVNTTKTAAKNANSNTATDKISRPGSVVRTKNRFATKIQNPGTENDNVSNWLPPSSKKTSDNTTDVVDNTSNKSTDLLNTKTTLPPAAIANTTAAINKKVDTTADKKQPVAEKAKEPQVTTSSKEKKKTSKGFFSNFGITLSGGADMSYVSLNNPGRTTFLYGAGLSYTAARRITVRAGFNVTKKIYSATPDQYNGTIYPNLDKIDGDCKVYEIPLSINYNFWQRKNHNWTAGAGISSYLMKKEHYNYEYKNAAGQYYYYKRTIDNENKHYFSVLTVSGGYQYNLNRHFSLMAEPYVKLPLKGVGYGKIKLNSAGVLMTLTVKPFAKKK